MNNAAVAHWSNKYHEAEEDINVNYKATIHVTETLLPFLKPSSAGARIIIMSSFLGQLKVCDPNLLTGSDYSSAYNQTSVGNLICISARFFIKLLWIRMA